jgi:hypothetical protein
LNDYIIETDCAYICIVSPKFGEFKAKINLEDIEICKEYHWMINRYRRKQYPYKFYALANIDGKLIFLHRFISAASQGEYVDHVNRDTLDNTRENLQICGMTINRINSKLAENNISGHKGVFWCHHLRTPKWKAFFMIKKKYLHLGYFDNYEDAVEAREKAEKEYLLSKDKQRKED